MEPSLRDWDLRGDLIRLLAGRRPTQQWYPAADIHARDDALVAGVGSPGMAREDIAAHWEPEALTLAGERKRRTDKGGVQEKRPIGHFMPSSQIGLSIARDQVQASCRGGRLEIALHRGSRRRLGRVRVSVE